MSFAVKFYIDGDPVSATNPLPVTGVAGGPSSNVIITDFVITAQTDPIEVSMVNDTIEFNAANREILTVTAAVSTLTVPAGMDRATIYARGTDGDKVNVFFDGGTNPDATTGVPLEVGEALALTNATDMANFAAFKDSAASADVVLVVVYHDKV